MTCERWRVQPGVIMGDNNFHLQGVGAVYHRVSTDRQDADRQRQNTGEWLTRHHAVVQPDHVLEDIGWARDEADRRPAFQRLLRLVDDRRIQWIVIDALERFGTKNKHQFISFIYRLQEAGCKLYTVNDKEWTNEDLITLIEAAFEAEKSEGEVRKLSDRVLGEMRLLAKRGVWLGGRVPYGMDVVALKLVGANLAEQWRVQFVGKSLRVKLDSTGHRKEYPGKGNFPPTESEEILQLRPTTDESKLVVVHRIYQMFVDEAISPNAIARRLNAEGIAPPAFIITDFWSQKHIGYMLSNPTYIGRPPWNRSTIGKYTSYVNGKHVSKKPGDNPRKLPEGDWILPDKPIFDGVVPLPLWNAAQEKLRSQPVRHCHPRAAALWLAGMVYCGNCGGVMHGVMVRSVGRIMGTRRFGTYVCGTANNWAGPKEKCPCRMYRVQQSKIEEQLQTYLEETRPLVREYADAMASGKPAALDVAIKHAVDAYWQMVQRLDGEQVECAGVPCVFLPGDGGHRVVPAGEGSVVAHHYRRLFEHDKEVLKSRLSELENEHTILTMSWQDLPTPKAKDKAKSRLVEFEEQIASIEDRLHNSAEDWERAVADVRRLHESWEQAAKALDDEKSARRKSELLRRVVDRIIVTFEPTGKRYPLGRVKQIEVVPQQLTAKDAWREGDLRQCELEFPRK